MSLAKPKIVILVLLVSVPLAMILARYVLAPMNVMAESNRDDYIAAELRAELLRIYQKRFVYPEKLEQIWNDPEFQDILKASFVTEDRSQAFSYQSSGATYEFRFTNAGRLIIERGENGAASREVVKLEPERKKKKN